MALEKLRKITTFATTELQEAGVYSMYVVKLIIYAYLITKDIWIGKQIVKSSTE